MKIRHHSESHIVVLDDESAWRIFPGDIDLTLNWEPETDLKIVHIDDDLSSHALINENDNSRVRVIRLRKNGRSKRSRLCLEMDSLGDG